jgi:signal transduction histidine kinase
MSGPALISAIVLIGYLYGQTSFYSYERDIGMSIITATGFGLLVLAHALSRPQEGIARLVTSGNVGAVMARRIVPAIIIVPLALGWLMLAGYESGLYSAGLGTAVLLVLTLVVLAGVVIYVASELTREQKMRNEVEIELKRSERQLRELTSHLQTVHENERVAVARRVHDEIGGLITAVKMDLNLLLLSVKNRVLNRPAEVQLEKIKLNVDKLFQSVRSVVSNLRPSLLDELGLLEAFDWKLSSIAKHSDLKCKYNCDVTSEIISEEYSNYATDLFRIFEEIVTNIIRHANATEVIVNVSASNDHLKIIVIDNGSGIARESNESSMSYGLIEIRQRIEGMRGTFNIVSGAAIGTIVKVRVPSQKKIFNKQAV